jgi:hypothetical protein
VIREETLAKRQLAGVCAVSALVSRLALERHSTFSMLPCSTLGMIKNVLMSPAGPWITGKLVVSKRESTTICAGTLLSILRFFVNIRTEQLKLSVDVFGARSFERFDFKNFSNEPLHRFARFPVQVNL